MIDVYTYILFVDNIWKEIALFVFMSDSEIKRAVTFFKSLI